MVEKVELKELKESIKDNPAIYGELAKQNTYINNAKRCEGIIGISIIGLLLAIFLWDSVISAIYFFIGLIIFNIFFMAYLIYKHLKMKGVL